MDILDKIFAATIVSTKYLLQLFPCEMNCGCIMVWYYNMKLSDSLYLRYLYIFFRTVGADTTVLP